MDFEWNLVKFYIHIGTVRLDLGRCFSIVIWPLSDLKIKFFLIP